MDRRDHLASLSDIPCTCAGKVFARNLPSIFLKAREVEKKALGSFARSPTGASWNPSAQVKEKMHKVHRGILNFAHKMTSLVEPLHHKRWKTVVSAQRFSRPSITHHYVPREQGLRARNAPQGRPHTSP